jgi:single-strand DNA-binding protein
MASLNMCCFIGNLGKDPDVRYLPNGDAVANFSIACTEKWKDKSTGETKEATEWVRICVFGKKAEIAGQYLKKGAPIHVTGRMRTRKYEKDGQDHYATEIIADNFIMLGGKREDSGDARAQQQAESYSRGGSNTQPAAAPPRNGNGFSDMDDDIPF